MIQTQDLSNLEVFLDACHLHVLPMLGERSSQFL